METVQQKREERARRSKRKTLDDFVSRAMSHAEKYDLPLVVFQVHPEDDAERRCLAMSTANKDFLFESIMAVITSDKEVGIRIISTLLKPNEVSEGLQEGDKVELLPPGDDIPEGSFRESMSSLAGAVVLVKRSKSGTVEVEPPGHEGTYIYPIQYVKPHVPTPQCDVVPEPPQSATGAEESPNVGPDSAVHTPVPEPVQDTPGDGGLVPGAEVHPIGGELSAD